MKFNFLFPFLALGCLAPSAAKKPNILFIFTDDHAPHAIGAYGSKLIETPNLDRIAREGMTFDRCYVTNSICAPARAVILSGRHSFHNGQMTNGDVFDGSQETFPKLLRKAGYDANPLEDGSLDYVSVSRDLHQTQSVVLAFETHSARRQYAPRRRPATYCNASIHQRSYSKP